MSYRGTKEPPKIMFTPKERAGYAINHQLATYPDGKQKDDLLQDLSRVFLHDMKAESKTETNSKNGQRFTKTIDPVQTAFFKAWDTKKLDTNNYIKDFVKGKITVTDGKRIVRVENYISGLANDKIGGAIDYTDVETLIRTRKYDERVIRSAFQNISTNPSNPVYNYIKEKLSDNIIIDLAKIAALREFKEEMGLNLDTYSDKLTHTLERFDHVFTLRLNPEEYTSIIQNPLERKTQEEHLTQAEVSAKWWNKYLKYKSKYLKLKKKISHVF